MKIQGIHDLREFCVHGRLRILNFRVNWNSNKSTPGPQDTRLAWLATNVNYKWYKGVFDQGLKLVRFTSFFLKGKFLTACKGMGFLVLTTSKIAQKVQKNILFGAFLSVSLISFYGAEIHFSAPSYSYFSPPSPDN